MAASQNYQNNTPTVTSGDTDPVTLSLLEDFKRNDPRVFGINLEFLNEMCIYCSSVPKEVETPSEEDIQRALENNAKFDLVSQGESRSSNSPTVWSQFMLDNAVWTANPRDEEYIKDFQFNSEVDGDYLIQYQIDDFLTVNIDGRQVIDARRIFRPSQQIQTATVRLTEGLHTISIKGTNTQGPGGVAFKMFLLKDYSSASGSFKLNNNEKYVVKNGEVYIRRDAPDCGPNENRVEDIFVANVNDIDPLTIRTYQFYGRPVLPGSHCDGSVDSTDLAWWDFDIQEITFPSNVSVETGDIDGDGIDAKPAITDRGCG
jgi:hypothetical protein